MALSHTVTALALILASVAAVTTDETEMAPVVMLQSKTRLREDSAQPPPGFEVFPGNIFTPAERATPNFSHPWNLNDMLKDTPSGAYFELMDPLLAANRIAYCAGVGPDWKADCMYETINNDYSGGLAPHLPTWERAHDVESVGKVDSPMQAAVLVDREHERTIVAIKGSCMATGDEHCRIDKCYLATTADIAGPNTRQAFDSWELNKCGDFAGKMDYATQARDQIQVIQNKFPTHATIVTGHGMGGMVAIIAAASQPGILKAFAFAPMPYHHFAEDRLSWKSTQFAKMHTDDIKAVFDHYDSGASFGIPKTTWKGIDMCTLSGVPQPAACDFGAELSTDKEEKFAQVLACKGSQPDFTRYLSTMHQRRPGSHAPLMRPTCNPGR